MNSIYFHRDGAYTFFDSRPDLKRVTGKNDVCDSCFMALSYQLGQWLLSPHGKGEMQVAVPEEARNCWKYLMGSPDATPDYLISLLEEGRGSFPMDFGKIGPAPLCPNNPHQTDIVVYHAHLGVLGNLGEWATARDLELKYWNGCPEAFAKMLGDDYESLPEFVGIDRDTALAVLRVTDPSMAEALKDLV